MKNLIFSLTLTTLALVSCKKERTCECTVDVTYIQSTIRRAGGFSEVDTSSYTQQTKDSYSKLKKKEMKTLVGCNSRTETSTSTYTTSFFGETSDVSTLTTRKYDCKIK